MVWGRPALDASGDRLTDQVREVRVGELQHRDPPVLR
jgi:hypothetical protein